MRGGKKLSFKFIRSRVNFEMLGREILNRAPKNSTGIYITSTGIQYGYRTNSKKFPDNFIPFDDWDVSYLVESDGELLKPGMYSATVADVKVNGRTTEIVLEVGR